MAYPLQAMLKIRTMREDRAASDLTRARRARAVAEQSLREKREARQRYEETKEERRDKVYDAVIGRPVKRDDLDQVRDAVTRIDEEGVLLEADEHTAEQTLEEKEKEATAARVRYVAAEKDKEKIVLHREAWDEEDRREQERAGDAELEEFTGKRTDDNV